MTPQTDQYTIYYSVRTVVFSYSLFRSLPQDVVAMLQQDMIAVQLSGDQTGLAFVNDVRTFCLSVSLSIHCIYVG